MDRVADKLAETGECAGVQARRPSCPRIDFAQDVARAHALARREEIVGEVERSNSLGFRARVAESECKLYEFCRRGRHPANECAARGFVDDDRSRLVAPLGREREMACALLRLFERMSQSAMGASPLRGGC